MLKLRYVSTFGLIVLMAICFAANDVNAEMGVTPAEKKLALYHGRWNGSVDPLFSEAIY